MNQNEPPADPVRYSIITQKNPREIVMLRGLGCAWRRCRFCDYHLDFSKNADDNYEKNRRELSRVTGRYHKLEVINSGSFTDLDERTISCIQQTCLEKQITTLHFECHWIHRNAAAAFRSRFQKQGIQIKLKTGVETFDYLFRECYLDKGISARDPSEIAHYFEEACLLQGIPGQTKESMERDIETGLAYFERICVNIMTKNSCPVQPDPSVIDLFVKELYPKYKDHPRIDILLNNTDFGVGGEQANA